MEMVSGSFLPPRNPPSAIITGNSKWLPCFLGRPGSQGTGAGGRNKENLPPDGWRSQRESGFRLQPIDAYYYQLSIPFLKIIC